MPNENTNLEIDLVSGLLRDHGISEKLIKKVAKELVKKGDPHEATVKEFINKKMP